MLGLQDQIGNFEVGKDFDAILVDPDVEGGPFDTFNSNYADSMEVSGIVKLSQEGGVAVIP